LAAYHCVVFIGSANKPHVSAAGEALLHLLANVVILGSYYGTVQPKWVRYTVTDYRWLAQCARQHIFTKSCEKLLSTQKIHFSLG